MKYYFFQFTFIRKESLPSALASIVSAWLKSESELWDDNVALSSSICGVGVSYPVIDDDDDVSSAIAVW